VRVKRSSAFEAGDKECKGAVKRFYAVPMARLPFDAGKMAAQPGPAPAGAASSASAGSAAPNSSGASGGAVGGAPALSVSQLAARIGQALGIAFDAPVRVVGEISNFSARTHWYFSIKDAGSVLNCVMFAGRTRTVGFAPGAGQQVVVTARVEVYEPQGRLTLNVERMEAVGAGALEQQLRQLIEQVRALGWLEPARKRALPVFARRVAVVTSAKGAALADVKDTMRKRCPATDVLLCDVLVQGAQAAPDVTSALRWLARHHQRLGLDAILVTRGGGSIEDLWTFNDREVARAIVESPVPVVAAIGHETDTTLAELVADLRCATPTQAAMALTPDRAALAQQLSQTGKRLVFVTLRHVQACAQDAASLARDLAGAHRALLQARGRALDQLATRLERARPASVLERRRALARELGARLRVAMTQRLQACARDLARARADLASVGAHALRQRAQHLASLERQLGLVGPEAVLRRGYSVTLSARGAIVRGPTDVATGEQMVTRLAEGEITSVVGKSLLVPLPRAGGRRRARTGGADAGPGLFGAPEQGGP
jgi:exodeoxyribonuclease VII large subunit